ncbi:MAG: DUF2062 domain-containing protein [Steroidobacterales bacterium]
MQRWLKKITPDRCALERHWFLKPFSAIFSRAQCWTFRRASVTRAFSLGLFIAFIPPAPPLPIHLLLCSIFGVMLRLNLPVLFATVFLSNPVTWLPQVLGSVWVGAKLLGMDFVPFVRQIAHQHMGDALQQLWSPLLLGSLVLGCIAATLGYILAQALWRARAIYHLRRRRAARTSNLPGTVR